MDGRTDGLLKRRGLLAGAAAMAGAGLAKLAGAGRVEATHGNPPPGAADGIDTRALHLGATNTQANGTITNLNGSTSVSLLTVRNAASLGGGLSASGSTSSLNGGYGVRGICGDSALSNQPPHVGVHGMDLQHGAGVGVRGDGTSIGVLGRSSYAGGQPRDTIGVRGESGAGQGVYGQADAGTGVYGTSTSGVGTTGVSRDAAGVYGFSTNAPGVYAASGASPCMFAETTRTAMWGRTTAGAGVLGQATGNGIGVYGAAGAGGWAGYFEGNLYVSGVLVQGSSAPATSAVQAADGTTRALYSQDSTEPLVEDVGEGTLVGGRAEVGLDPDFAAVAEGGAYQVFLTEYGDLGGLFVAARTPGGFEVRSRAGAGGGFGYRVVARRRGAGGKRLDRLERPRGLNARELQPPSPPATSSGEPEKPAPGGLPTPRPPTAR